MTTFRTMCTRCDGKGRKVINGVTWLCMNCMGTGQRPRAKVQA